MSEPSPPKFVFVTCQLGAEAAVKDEISRQWSDWRLAFSRPGFLTFKLPEGRAPRPGFDLRSVFARASGFALGRVHGAEPQQLAADAWRLACQADIALQVRALHVWQRDTAVPGDHGYLPGPSVLSDEIEQTLRRAAAEVVIGGRSPRLLDRAGANDDVLDCILIEPDEWCVAWHRATTPVSRCPGGTIPITLPTDAVSRAYLKMEEALRWSRLPLHDGDPCVEIGAAPGGASQALLARGLVVNGIDPADMDPIVLSHPNFHHLRMRGSDLRRREFVGVRWLMADMNVAPKFTLDCVEQIVTHPEVKIRGMLLTLKLPDWNLAHEVPALIDRVRSWGYRDVRARQLASNRQEFCVAALRRRAQRRLDRRRTNAKRNTRKPTIKYK